MSRNPEHLGLKTWVNGELRQNGNTSDFTTPRQMLEELTTVLTLEPGDILTTGSPGGVGAAGGSAALPEGWRCDSDRDRMPGAIENGLIAGLAHAVS